MTGEGVGGQGVSIDRSVALFTSHSLCNALTQTQLTRAYYYTTDSCNGVVPR